MASKNLLDFISESYHIIKAHRRHFYTLSSIFLFPFSFSLILYPTLSNHFQQHHTSLFFTLLYSLFLSILSYSGVISITYSVFHFFYDQPVNLLSAINSISTSFLPLLATTIVSQLIFFFISLFYGLLLLLLTHGAAFLHVTIPYSLPLYLIAFFVALPLLLVMTYLQVKWTLVPVIVVVESCWGLEPLRRSTRLIKGMKGVALSSMIFYGFFTWAIVLSCLFYVTKGSDGDNWFSVVFNWVYVVCQSWATASVIMPSNLAVNTVLYIYCKANHGEIVEEFGKDYVSLPFHDGNVSHAV